MIRNRSKPLIALGANLPSDAGSAVRTLVGAIGILPDHDLPVRAVSRFFRTPCFPPGAGPDFVNAVVQVEASLPPAEVLAALHGVELDRGRVRDVRWGARTLDLDLLACGAAVLPDLSRFRSWQDMPPGRQVRDAPRELILPHPRLQDRAFVLVPLADIAPDWRHPVSGLMVTEMLGRLPAREIEQVVPL